VLQVAVGSSHALGLTANGTIVTFGSSDEGQLDVPDDKIGMRKVHCQARLLAFFPSDVEQAHLCFQPLLMPLIRSRSPSVAVVLDSVRLLRLSPCVEGMLAA
jgi:hypothetical protein